MELNTGYKINWCAGCPNFAILEAFKQTVAELVAEKKLKPEEVVFGSGIGCHGKMGDYLNLSSFYGLHGRIIPTMTGVKLANPKLKVAVFSGDGDSLAEGMEHFIHAAKRNSDIKLFLHNNQVFALTTGQVTPTSAKGYKGRTTPAGSVEEPIIPLALSLLSGATFVARTYALKIAETKEIMKQAMNHKGFAIVEIIQPCITFADTREFFKDKLEWLPKTYDKTNQQKALQILTTPSTKVQLGVFYQASRPTYEEQI